jgi:GNAT superfamily N-acetyltransferase
MVDIRAATPADADAIAAAHIEGWRVGYRHLLPDDYLDAPSFAKQRLDRWRMWTWADCLPDSQVYVPVIDGRVVGFAHCGSERVQPTCDQSGQGGDASATTGERGEVYGFYLHPETWGSGAAMPLIERCHEHLRAAGFGEAVLWVLRDNPRARAFYEKSGWHPTGRSMMFEGPQTIAAPAISLPEVEYRTQLS